MNDLDDVPFYLRESVQRIIDNRVKRRIAVEMAEFKETIRKEVVDMKSENQMIINEQIPYNHLNIRPGTGWYGKNNAAYYGNYGRFNHPNSYGAGFDPRFGGAPPLYGHPAGYGAGQFGGRYPGLGYGPYPATAYAGHPGYYGELADPAMYGPYRHVSPVRNYGKNKNVIDLKPTTSSRVNSPGVRASAQRG